MADINGKDYLFQTIRWSDLVVSPNWEDNMNNIKKIMSPYLEFDYIDTGGRVNGYPFYFDATNHKLEIPPGNHVYISKNGIYSIVMCNGKSGAKTPRDFSNSVVDLTNTYLDLHEFNPGMLSTMGYQQEEVDFLMKNPYFYLEEKDETLSGYKILETTNPKNPWDQVESNSETFLEKKFKTLIPFYYIEDKNIVGMQSETSISKNSFWFKQNKDYQWNLNNKLIDVIFDGLDSGQYLDVSNLISTYNKEEKTLTISYNRYSRTYTNITNPECLQIISLERLAPLAHIVSSGESSIEFNNIKTSNSSSDETHSWSASLDNPTIINIDIESFSDIEYKSIFFDHDGFALPISNIGNKWVEENTQTETNITTRYISKTFEALTDKQERRADVMSDYSLYNKGKLIMDKVVFWFKYTNFQYLPWHNKGFIENITRNINFNLGIGWTWSSSGNRLTSVAYLDSVGVTIDFNNTIQLSQEHLGTMTYDYTNLKNSENKEYNGTSSWKATRSHILKNYLVDNSKSGYILDGYFGFAKCSQEKTNTILLLIKD